jgi:hypothetical protein
VVVSPDWHRVSPAETSPEGLPQHSWLLAGKSTGQFVPLIAHPLGQQSWCSGTSCELKAKTINQFLTSWDKG